MKSAIHIVFMLVVTVAALTALTTAAPPIGAGANQNFVPHQRSGGSNIRPTVGPPSQEGGFRTGSESLPSAATDEAQPSLTGMPPQGSSLPPQGSSPSATTVTGPPPTAPPQHQFSQGGRLPPPRGGFRTGSESLPSAATYEAQPSPTGMPPQGSSLPPQGSSPSAPTVTGPPPTAPPQHQFPQGGRPPLRS